MEGLMVLLVQEMVYACNLGEEDECRKKEILVVSDQLVPEEVRKRKLASTFTFTRAKTQTIWKPFWTTKRC